MPNTYTPGECTWGAANLAGWIPSGLGNADTWLPRAGGLGLMTSSAPQPGAAMVFNSSYPGSSGFGHVGIVQSIAANGYPIIEEMNATRNGGGFNKYDLYQTGPQDLAYLEGYVLPPSGTASSVTSSTLTSYMGTSPPTAQLTGGLDFSGPFGWLFPKAAVPGGPGYVDTNLGDLFGGLITFLQKAGEVLLGVALMVYGAHLIMKETNGSSPLTSVVKSVPVVGKFA